MELLSYLTSLELDTFHTFVFYWGLVGILSFFAIHYLKIMPMSGRCDVSLLEFLGKIDKRKGWIIMEIPILVVVISFYFLGDKPVDAGIIILAAFVMHYFNRALIFPYRIKAEGKTMPVSMMLSSMSFYIINGYLVGHYFGALASYEWNWLYDPRFLPGMALFLFGFYINITSDNILINLR